MKRVLRQWLAGLLSVVLVFTLLPAAALAEEADGPTEHITVQQVQALIDALPDADTITADNRADVEAQLAAIDAAKLELTVDEAAALDITRYDAAVEAIQALDDMTGADEPRTIAANVPYIGTDGTGETCLSATEVESSITAWNNDEGWYVVNGSVIVSDRITVTGNVNLILADGCTLTALLGITVNTGNSLTIWGQSGGTGTLIAKGGTDPTGLYGEPNAWLAGIGSGSQGDKCGAITINGGNVKATAEEGWNAGIGGEEAKITINGGNVTATGGRYSAGIGAGSENGADGSNPVTITINGGTVNAHGGGATAAGIGAGATGHGANITITGGNVTAVGVEEGAGIGGARDNTVTSKIEISGGSVTANSSGNNPAIYGDFSTGSEPDGNAVIYASGIISDKSKQNNWSGIIFERNAGTVYGDQTLRPGFALTGGQSLTVGNQASLTVPSDMTLTVPSGVTVTNNGTINVGT